VNRSATAPIPPTAERLSAWHANSLWLRTIIGSVGHRLVKRRKRVRSRVASDYDSGEWAQQKTAANWLQSSSATDYADKSWIKHNIVAEMSGALWLVPAPDYYAFRRSRLTEILHSYDDGVRTLIELGSGTGSNLFALSSAGHWDRLIGLELSPTGREVTRAIAEHFALSDQVTSDFIDLLDTTSKGFEKLSDAICFTHYCLEQLPDQTETVFRNILAAKPRRVIMFEPTFELLGSTLKDAASRAYVLRQDYQRSIVRVARKLESEGSIRIREISRLDFVSSCRNPPTLIVWEPK